jgi:hypothetical protein
LEGLVEVEVTGPGNAREGCTGSGLSRGIGRSPSLKWPMMDTCSTEPKVMILGWGDREMERRRALVTVRMAMLPTRLPLRAVMVVTPGWRAMTRPLLLMTATSGFELDQTMESAIWGRPWSKMATALNWRVRPLGREGELGTTRMEVGVWLLPRATEERSSRRRAGATRSRTQGESLEVNLLISLYIRKADFTLTRLPMKG